MYVNAALHKVGIVIKALAVLAICSMLLIYSQSSCKGAESGIEFCLSVLIPSLFPFMAVSGFLIKSGLSHRLGKPFGKLTRKIFGLGGEFAPIILLSMIGGYPVGARGIASLKVQGRANDLEAEKAALFAVCAGPGFIVNFVGMSLYGSKTIGAVLLASQMLSVIILGIAVNFFYKGKGNNNSFAELNSPKASVSTALVEAVADSSKGILAICAFVVLFSALTAIISEITSDQSTRNLIYCLLEVCTAVKQLSQSSPVETVAFAVGFGGLCVHFQIFSALGDLKINKLIFFVIRLVQGAITAVLAHIGLALFPAEATVFSSASVSNADTFTGSIASGIVIIAVAVCFLFTLKSYKTN